MPNIILPVPKARKLCRLRCEVMADNGQHLEKDDREVRQVIERFIRDMEKQGWRWAGGDFELHGPFPATEGAGLGLLSVPDQLENAEAWRYLTIGLFFRDLPTQMEVLVDEDEPAYYPRRVMKRLYADYAEPYDPLTDIERRFKK